MTFRIGCRQRLWHYHVTYPRSDGTVLDLMLMPTPAALPVPTTEPAFPADAH